MRLAIMQPYFLPYHGYFQLLAAVDAFVIYDDIQFTKSGWIHRNRIAVNGAPAWITLPLRQDATALDIRDRRLADGADDELARLRRRIEGAYRAAPHRDETLALVARCLSHQDRSLFGFVRHAVVCVAEHLDIRTPLVMSSTLGVDRALRGQDRVLATCRAMGADTYVNPPGGVALYERAAFAAEGISLGFLQPEPMHYAQGSPAFVPSLSIIDPLMHVGRDGVRAHLPRYTLA